MASLILLLDSLVYIMFLAVLNGSAGFVNARNTFETILTKITTATETSTAIQIGEMVCA